MKQKIIVSILMAVIMTLVMSFIMVVVKVGLNGHFLPAWGEGFALAFIPALVLSFILPPLLHRLVAKIFKD